MKKLCTLFLALAMLMSLAVPAALASAPAFPDGSSISILANGRALQVTYPNTALLPDGTVAPAYKVEVVATDAGNAPVCSSVFATEEHLISDTTAVLPRLITLPAERGNFGVNVYPLSSADSETAVSGAAISGAVTINEPALPDGAVRYEFEDYAPEAYPNGAEALSCASGGKVFTSHNGKSDWFAQTNYIKKDADASTSFTVTIPEDGVYTAEYIMNINNQNNNLSVLELAIDGTPIGSNTSEFSVENLSMGGTYPWQYTHMYRFEKSGLALTAGTHTVTITVTAPTNESQDAHIFVADYLQFTPEAIPVTDTKKSVIEFENYAGKLITDDGTGENTTSSNVVYSANTSGGAAFHTDSYANDDINLDALLTIPLSVKASGTYNIEYVASKANSHTNIYLDNADLTSLYENTAVPDITFKCHTGKDMASLGLDGKEIYSKENFSFWKYFWRGHHAAELHTGSIYLEEGEHTLTFELKTRGGSTPTVAICMDYMTLTPVSLRANISATDKSTLEMEDYTGCITSAGEPYTGATVTADEVAQQYASEGKLLNMSERQALTDATITIPVSVEADGDYLLGWYVTNAGNGAYLSRLTLCIDGQPVLINDAASVKEDLAHDDENGKHTYISQYYPMALYEARIPLTAGDHTITMVADAITTFVNDAYGVKFYADCITFSPVSLQGVTVSGDTVIEMENYVDHVLNGEAYYTGCSVTEDSRANGGKYMGVSYGYAEEAVISIPVTVTAPGWYDVDAIMTKKTSSYISAVTLSLDGETILNNQTEYVVEDLSENNSYLNGNFPMHRYSNQAFLTEGTHTLTLKADKTVGDSVVKFFADCIKLTPAKDSVSIAEDVAVYVSAIYDAPVNGTGVVALYKGGRLIKTQLVSAENATKLEATVLFDETPDTVKILVFENLTSAKPVAEAKVFTEFETKSPWIYLMGDSVCITYGTNAIAQQGWGHFIGSHFTPDVMVSNDASGGKSTKTYKSEGLWDSVYNAISVGDFVMINFGLNDFYDISETGKGTTIEQYKANLTEYCTLIQEKGATPILISTIPECNTSHTALIARADAMREVAAACDVTFLELNDTLNKQWILDENGEYDADKVQETYDTYYMSETAFTSLEEKYGTTIPQEKWDYIASVNDRTHINIDGAKYVAQTIADLLSASDSNLKKFLK